MSAPGHPSAAHDASEHPSTSESSYGVLEAAVHEAARAQASDLAARWESQIKSVALMDGARTRQADEDEARCLVTALLAALAPEGDEAEEAIAHGLRFGSDAFAGGTSLHHTMKALDLLLAMTMYAMERSLDEVAAGQGSASQGIRLARKLQRRAALLSLAATRGYMQAYAEALRERFRHLRHDLRNPLGTIKSVLSLMDDETVPPGARSDPRFQAMAKRNARSLEELIADRLSDAAALLPVVAGQDVSLRSVACGVRRELRGEIERQGVTLLVGPVAPYGRLDAASLELLLRGALEAVIQESSEGDQLHLEFGDTTDDQARVIISCESGRPPIGDPASLGRLTTLARQMGATITAGDSLLVSVPMRARDERASDRELTREAVSLGDGETRDDVGGARQRDHGQTGAL